MRRTIILAGSHIEEIEWTKRQITKEDFIICADGGAHHAKIMGITPDLVIGDFDSVSSEVLEFFKNNTDVEVCYDSDQYTTDLMKALGRVIEGTRVDIYGAIGKRADHDLSNYLMLLNMKNPDHVSLRSHADERRVIKSDYKFSGTPGEAVGVFPLNRIANLEFVGLEYDASGLEGPYDFGWNGACNTLKEKNAEIRLDSGAALVIRTYNP